MFAAIVLSASPARADLEICNRTSFIVEAAIGIEDQGVTATRGWFRVDPGACRAVMRGDPSFERLFAHVRALPLYGAVKPMHGNEVQLCVGDGEFLIAGARDCKRDRQRLVPFGEMQPRASEAGRAIFLAEPADYGPEQARLAAVQRLLTLAGYNAEPVDGVAGPKTDAALARFLRERNLPDDAPAASAFLDLLASAVREGAGAGLLWCNETAHTVMAALGVEEDGGVVTRGWWRIEAGACLRPELPQKTVKAYSFAEAVDGAGAVIERKGKALTWGGAMRLCVRNSRFEIREHKDCAARGLATQGFATVELPAGATVRFQEP
ncbi:MAG: DUF1036 domain-containing protein [Bradyrhizobiaceae bacterium]|nr:DUF1036 domain-containing protein [Bradyrhizobiaceae bacterium]